MESSFFGLPPQAAAPEVLSAAMDEGQPKPGAAPSRTVTGYMDLDRAGLGGDDALAMIVQDMKDLYECNPRDEIFERCYAPEAVFEDPLGRLEGRQAVREAFKGLAQVFEFRGWTPEDGGRFQLVDVDAAGRRLRFEIETRYRVKGTPLVLPFKTSTTVVLEGGQQPASRAAAGQNVAGGMPEGDHPPSYQDLTDTMLIREHTDAWMGVPLATPENSGWVGSLAEYRRKASGLMQRAFVKAVGAEGRYGQGHAPNT